MPHASLLNVNPVLSEKVFKQLITNWGKAADTEDMAKWILVKTPKFTEKNMVSKVFPLVKTHKKQVSVRMVHSSVNNVYNVYSAVLQRLLLRKLRPAKHLCRSTDDLIKMLGSLRLSPGDRLVSIDIEDFYLNGTHEELAKAAFEDDPGGNVGAEVLEWVLQQQLVSSDLLDDPYMVCTGSGIGQRMSGELSDWFFW